MLEQNKKTRKHTQTQTHTKSYFNKLQILWEMFYQEPETETDHKVRDEQVLLRWKKGKT